MAAYDLDTGTSYEALIPLSWSPLLFGNLITSPRPPTSHSRKTTRFLRNILTFIPSFTKSTYTLNSLHFITMQYTALLTLALSASTFAFPAPANLTDSESDLSLEKRKNSEIRIGSFGNQFCEGKPVGKWTDGNDFECFKFTPSTDNVGIDWSTMVRALGINFFTDDKCGDDKWATTTLYAPQSALRDNGKGKADKCISYKANGGNWKSAKFIYPAGQAFVDWSKWDKEQKKKNKEGGK
ncbi:MAG: hypothetical protein Q9192_002910 [Flavoplaca navasiana]